MPKKLRLYSHSRLDTFRSCPRKFYYSYVRSWSSEGTGIALVFGSAFHAALDVIWTRHLELSSPKTRRDVIDAAYIAFLTEWLSKNLPHPDDMSPDDIDQYSPRTPMVAQEMLFSYVEARENILCDPSFKLLDVERPFAVPLDPGDDTLFFVGKLDKVFSYRKQVLIMEHKTTSSYRKGGPFRSDYIDSFSPNSQIDGYLYVLHKLCADQAFGPEHTDPGGIWVDACLVHAQVHDGFKIIPIDRRIEHLDQWLWTTINWVDQIEGNRAALAERNTSDLPYLPTFPQNTVACSGYGGCGYRDLCKAYANPADVTDIPLGYIEKTHSLFDTIKLEKLGFTLADTEEAPPSTD